MDVSPLALLSAHYRELDGDVPLDALAAGIAEVQEMEKKPTQDTLLKK